MIYRSAKTWQNLGMLHGDCLELSCRQTECLQDGWRNLGCLNVIANAL